MKAVLRIAFRYFDFLPLQRWVNILGVSLLVIGLTLTLLVSDPRAAIRMTFFLSMPGALLIVMAPLSVGGLALRYASSRTLMHLRPHGRIRMLLGSTLALTLLAVVVTLPMLALYHVLVDLGSGRQLPPTLQPKGWLLASWAFATATCLIMFISSSSRTLTLMMPALAAAVLFGMAALNPLALDLRIIFAAGLSAWAIFAIWYWRVPKINRPMWMSDVSPLGFGNWTIGPLERLSPTTGGRSHSRALRQYLLGTDSLPSHVVTGAIPALLLIVLTMAAPKEDGMRLNPMALMFMFTFVSASLGYMIARRARYLWLRAGLDRAALFRQSERTGLPTALLMFCISAVILLAATIPGRQEQMPVMMLYAATIGALATGLFYFGLSLTRGWNVGDVLLGLGIFLLGIAVLVSISPRQDPAITTLWIAAGLFTLLALVLRWLAVRRWNALDWRIARPMTVPRR